MLRAPGPSYRLQAADEECRPRSARRRRWRQRGCQPSGDAEDFVFGDRAGCTDHPREPGPPGDPDTTNWRGLAKSRQSASMKQSAACMGTSVPSRAARTASTWQPRPSTSCVRSRRFTYRRRSVRNQPPLSRRWIGPWWALASTTQTPEAATARWSMFPQVHETARSCRSTARSPTRSARIAARRRSPLEPSSKIVSKVGRRTGARRLRRGDPTDRRSSLGVVDVAARTPSKRKRPADHRPEAISHPGGMDGSSRRMGRSWSMSESTATLRSVATAAAVALAIRRDDLAPRSRAGPGPGSLGYQDRAPGFRQHGRQDLDVFYRPGVPGAQSVLRRRGVGRMTERASASRMTRTVPTSPVPITLGGRRGRGWWGVGTRSRRQRGCDMRQSEDLG
jgi:hypothetical protein